MLCIIKTSNFNHAILQRSHLRTWEAAGFVCSLDICEDRLLVPDRDEHKARLFASQIKRYFVVSMFFLFDKLVVSILFVSFTLKFV